MWNFNPRVIEWANIVVFYSNATMPIQPLLLWFVPSRVMVNGLCLFQNNWTGMTEVEQKNRNKNKNEWAIKVLAMHCATDLKFNDVSAYPLQLYGFSTVY